MTKVYTLFLNTANATKPLSNLAENPVFSPYSIWNVNWDDLFERENYKYLKCRVKFKLVSVESMVQNSIADSYINAYLVSNLGTNQQSDFLKLGGSILGLVVPQVITEKNNASGVAYSTDIQKARFLMKGETLSSEGVEVSTPIGFTSFSLSLLRVDLQINNNLLYAFADKDYNILLQFSFDD